MRLHRSAPNSPRDRPEGDTAPNSRNASSRSTNGARRANETASLDVYVTAQAEGSSELRVKKPDGSIWGSVTLSVEKAASFQLTYNTQGAVTLAQGDACPVTWRATDANGAGLMSTEGIFLTSSDANVVAFKPFIGTEDFTHAAPTPSGAVSIDARGPGDATVTALGPAGVLGGNATETLMVHVTPYARGRGGLASHADTQHTPPSRSEQPYPCHEPRT